jgi:hypothetical protein
MSKVLALLLGIGMQTWLAVCSLSVHSSAATLHDLIRTYCAYLPK